MKTHFFASILILLVTQPALADQSFYKGEKVIRISDGKPGRITNCYGGNNYGIDYDDGWFGQISEENLLKTNGCSKGGLCVGESVVVPNGATATIYGFRPSDSTIFAQYTERPWYSLGPKRTGALTETYLAKTKGCSPAHFCVGESVITPRGVRGTVIGVRLDGTVAVHRSDGNFFYIDSDLTTVIYKEAKETLLAKLRAGADLESADFHTIFQICQPQVDLNAFKACYQGESNNAKNNVIQDLLDVCKATAVNGCLERGSHYLEKYAVPHTVEKSYSWYRRGLLLQLCGEDRDCQSSFVQPAPPLPDHLVQILERACKFDYVGHESDIKKCVDRATDSVRLHPLPEPSSKSYLSAQIFLISKICASTFSSQACLERMADIITSTRTASLSSKLKADLEKVPSICKEEAGMDSKVTYRVLPQGVSPDRLITCMQIRYHTFAFTRILASVGDTRSETKTPVENGVLAKDMKLEVGFPDASTCSEHDFFNCLVEGRAAR